MTKEEWLDLIKIRPELENQLIIDESKLTKKEDVKNRDVISINLLKKLGFARKDFSEKEMNDNV